MTKCIAWELPNGSISITYPVETISPEETEDQFLNRIAAKVVLEGIIPEAISRTSIDTALLPSKQFRDAWVLNGSTIGVDLAKAKQIHKTRLKLKLASKFNQLQLDRMMVEDNEPLASQIDEDITSLRVIKADIENQINNANDITTLQEIQLL